MVFMTMYHFVYMALSDSKTYSLVKKSVLKLPKKMAMGKSRSLTLDQRHRVLWMLEGGMSVTAAARQIRVHHSTVSRLRS